MGYLLFFPSVSGPERHSGARSFAQRDVTALTVAANAYLQEYGALPSGDHATVLAALRGANPRKIQFVEIPEDRIEDGKWIDPWKTPYRFDFSPGQLHAWSAGPDRIDNHGKGDSDDVTSGKWRSRTKRSAKEPLPHVR